MKKIIILFMVLAIAFITCACTAGNNEINNTDTVEPTIPAVTEKETEPNGQQDEKDEQHVKEVVQLLEYDIYVDCPEGKYIYNEAKIYAMRDPSKYDYVALVYDASGNFTGTLEEAIDHLIVKFERVGSSFTYGIMDDCPYEITFKEDVQVNGFDSIKFSGTVNREDGKQYYFYGYSFIIDDIPCAVIGVVSDPESGEAERKAIEDETDLVASTIRTEK